MIAWFDSFFFWSLLSFISLLTIGYTTLYPFKYHFICTSFFCFPPRYTYTYTYAVGFVLFECWSMVCIPCCLTWFSWSVDMSILIIYVLDF